MADFEVPDHSFLLHAPKINHLLANTGFRMSVKHYLSNIIIYYDGLTVDTNAIWKGR